MAPIQIQIYLFIRNLSAPRGVASTCHPCNLNWMQVRVFAWASADANADALCGEWALSAGRVTAIAIGK